MCRRFAWQELPAVYSAWKRIAKERVRGNQKRDGICHRVFDFSFFAILRVQTSCRSAVHCSHALQRVASIKTLWFFLCPAGDSSLHLPTGRAARQQTPGKSVLRQLRIAFASIAPLCWQRSIFGPIYSLILQQSTPLGANAKPRSTCSCKAGSLHP